MKTLHRDHNVSLQFNCHVAGKRRMKKIKDTAKTTDISLESQPSSLQTVLLERRHETAIAFVF